MLPALRAGSLDAGLAALSELRVLALANNQLTGTLPPAFWPRLSRLQRLDLSGNPLEVLHLSRPHRAPAPPAPPARAPPSSRADAPLRACRKRPPGDRLHAHLPAPRRAGRSPVRARVPHVRSLHRKARSGVVRRAPLASRFSGQRPARARRRPMQGPLPTERFSSSALPALPAGLTLCRRRAQGPLPAEWFSGGAFPALRELAISGAPLGEPFRAPQRGGIAGKLPDITGGALPSLQARAAPRSTPRSSPRAAGAGRVSGAHAPSSTPTFT